MDVQIERDTERRTDGQTDRHFPAETKATFRSNIPYILLSKQCHVATNETSLSKRSVAVNETV